MGTVSHKLNSDDVLANTITALEILKSTSDAISMVPLLGAVLGAALSLVSTIDRVRGDRDRSIRLAKRVSNLMMQVERSVASSRNALDDENMATSLAALQSTLMGIQEDLEALAKRTILFRFLHRGSMARRLEEHLERLDDVSRLFTIDCLVALRSKMALSTQYDDQQIRLLRFCDIKLQRNCGEWHSRYGVSGDEWSGEWEGRAVSIRILRGDNSTEHTLRSLVTSLPICHYPYIAQIVGKSHPSVSSRFYVLERGPVSVCHYASVVVSLKKLRWYLQMYVDYEETFRYLQSLNFPLARTGEAHTHDHCLPSLAIKEDGTLLLSAEDLVSRNLDCLAQTFRDLFRDGDRVFETDRSPLHTIAQNPRALLSTLQPNVDRAMVARDIDGLYDAGRDTGLAEVWTLSWYRTFSHVQIGDYGYADNRTQQFVRLGNVFDLLQKNCSSSWHFGHYRISPTGEFVTEALILNYVWTARVWRFSPEASGES